MILTSEQLAELTDKKRPKDQINWLLDRGYRFEISAAGRPKVLIKEIEGKMLSPESRTRMRRSAPDLGAINSN